MMNKVNLLSLNQEELKSLVISLGEKPFRAKQLEEWLTKAVPVERMGNLPLSFREKLEEVAVLPVLKTLVHQKSNDGTEKFLFAFPDGQSSECVLMRYKYGNSACVSTQIGCRMGCAFCASTKAGLVRNLEAGEIIAEIAAITRESGERVDSLVLMGTGEPLDNFEEVLRFLHLVTSPNGFHLGARHISLSTCGICPKIRALAEEKLQITLSVSLHAPNDTIRRQLMPVSRTYAMPELIDACRYYFQTTGRRISYEYAMIRGVNDSLTCAEELADLLAGQNAHVNLIPLNNVKESPFKPSERKTVDSFVEYLSSHDVNVTVRRKLGRDIDAACGQLRANHLK